MSLKKIIKRKLPATFNASEYHTGLLLNRIQELEHALDRQGKMTAQVIRELKQMQSEQLQQLEKAATIFKGECEGMQKSIIAALQDVVIEGNAEHLEALNHMSSTILASEDSLLKHINQVEKRIDEGNLFSIRNCKSDAEFDHSIVPLNRFFDNKGMALSMYLTSADEKPDPIIYDNADIIRTGALSLIADEINQRKLIGSVAELGVAKGAFARVINAVFPDRKLFLFDTFEGFQEQDVSFDLENGYSHAKTGLYSDADVDEVLRQMRYPENCVVCKGYFPNSTVGLEQEHFAFVSIDCDLYKPIYAGLEFFYPRMVQGGCIFVHDYRSKYYRGVKIALTEYAQKNNISYSVIPDNTGSAIILK